MSRKGIRITVVPAYQIGDLILRTEAPVETPGIYPDFVGWVVGFSADPLKIIVSDQPPGTPGARTTEADVRAFMVVCPAKKSKEEKKRRDRHEENPDAF